MSFLEIPILCYHQITKIDRAEDIDTYAISRSQLELQMRYLYNHGYRCLTLADLLHASVKTSLQKKSFVLTFDDGYKDFLTQAYPLLHRYGFTATVFLVTDFVGKQSDWVGKEGTPMLTCKQVQALHKAGITFGSHTCSHAHLPSLSTEQMWNELTTSKNCIEAKLGQEITFLAYPYGASNNKVQEMAMKAGYKAACGISLGPNGHFNLWRCLCCGTDNLRTFIFRLSRWYRYCKCLRNTKAGEQFVRRIKHHTLLRSHIIKRYESQ